MDTPHGCISTCAQCSWRKIRVRGIQNKERIISPLLKKTRCTNYLPLIVNQEEELEFSRHGCKIQI